MCTYTATLGSSQPKGNVMSNQSDARERAYQNYASSCKAGADTQTLNQLWAVYLAKLSADSGAAQAPKKH